MSEKHKPSKINSETNSGNFAVWLVVLMDQSILRQQFRNTAYSPTKEAKRAVLTDWSRLSDRIGQARFSEGLLEAFLHTTFIPSCEDIERYAPAEASEAEMYRPFPVLEPPKDPVTPEQIEQLTKKIQDIADGKVMVKKASLDRQELHEKISRGMKAQVIDKKVEAANDK